MSSKRFKFEHFVTNQGKRYGHEVALAHKLYLNDTLTSLYVGEGSNNMRPSSGLRHGGHHPEGEEGKGTLGGDKGFLCLGGLCMMLHSSLAGSLWVRQFQRVAAA